MNLGYYAALPQIRRIEAKDVAELQTLEWDPDELLQLRVMNREELMGLMAFCGIRTYNDMPVIACEDDELRMAYFLWRGYYSLQKRQAIWPIAQRWKNKLSRLYDLTMQDFEPMR